MTRARPSVASVREFYDALAGDYHLIYADWRNGVARQGAVLDRLIRSILGPDARTVLDCACGIGTQAIGLAVRGYEVTASDVSVASVARAREEARAFGADVSFTVADMRDLGEVGGPFDVVVACDNALPHLTSDEELAAAARSVCAALRPGGLFVASIRDYDEAVATRPAVTQPQVFDGPGGRRIVFQAWDWAPDGRTYRLDLFIVRRDADGEWSMGHHQTVYRALLRSEVDGVLAAAGLTGVRWHMPDASGFFQPLVTARRPAGPRV